MMIALEGASAAPPPFAHTALRSAHRVITNVGRRIHPDIFQNVNFHSNAAGNLAKRYAREHLTRKGRDILCPEQLEIGGLLHDIGKYRIDQRILLKPGKLNRYERALMDLHPIHGGNILSGLPGFNTPVIRNVVVHHHEHWDGSGYPDGLSGTNIPFESRLFDILDVYVALRERRPYKKSFSVADSCAIILEEAGRGVHDPYIAEEFVRTMMKEPNADEDDDAAAS